MKYPNMECFIGSGFDVEFKCKSYLKHFRQSSLLGIDNTQEALIKLSLVSENHISRPRLNDPQSLDDWSWVEGLNGLVWRKHRLAPHGLTNANKYSSSEQVWIFGKKGEIFSFAGVEKGSDLEEWARSVDVPILGVS